MRLYTDAANATSWGVSAMTKPLVNRWIAAAGGRSARRWPQTAAIASALLLTVSVPASAADLGGFFGGVVGGMLQQQMQQPPPQQYYQPQPQYYQQAPAQRRSTVSAAEIKRQAELKAKKEQEEKDKKEQEAAAAAVAAPAPAIGGTSGPLDVAMKRKAGNLWVPAQINKVVTIDFVIDSGASDITLPRDVYLTLIRSGTLTKANYLGSAQFGIADGSEVKGLKFKLASLQVGDQVLTDVVASVMPSDSATPLLGLSFLSRFQSWSIDNNSGTLKLVPIGAAKPAAPVQVASAGGAQALPEPPAADSPEPPKAGVAAAVTTVAPPAPGPMAAAEPAPRSGHVATSAFVVKEAPGAAAPAAPAAATAPTGNVPVFPANTAYGSARSTLLALGYGPAPLPDAGKCDSNTDTTCFPERASCAKADAVQCDFLWRRGDQLIKVKTVAIPPTISAVECQVNCK
jgi:clan AA aspartic protease (TIGR02281 family)